MRKHLTSSSYITVFCCCCCCCFFRAEIIHSVFLVLFSLSNKKRFDHTFLAFFVFVDIDECASGTHNCHSSLASCTNTVGSFSCSCNNPYTGNGRTCNLPSGNQLSEYYEDVYLLELKYACERIVVTSRR